jgi:alpha-tubulin suppressor-like RCC1 family protein
MFIYSLPKKTSSSAINLFSRNFQYGRVPYIEIKKHADNSHSLNTALIITASLCLLPINCGSRVQTKENRHGDVLSSQHNAKSFSNSADKQGVSASDSIRNVNECKLGLNNCDKQNGTCIDTENGYRCDCKPGWSLPLNDSTCVEEFVAKGISAGNGHTCGIKTDGTVECWGSWDNSNNPDGRFVRLTGGSGFSCGLREDGSASCFGWSTHPVVRAKPPQGPFIQISAGSSHVCAVRKSGKIVCWGDNEDEECNAPEGVFTQVSSGTFHSCALTKNGDLKCWGWMEGKPPAEKFKEISAGHKYTCGLNESGKAFCWGDNQYGQAVPPNDIFIHILARSENTCGEKANGKILCWGRFPVFESQNKEPYKQITVGSGHVCELRPSGRIVCWGDDDDGESRPPMGPLTQISAGVTHACGLKPGGTAVCWMYSAVETKPGPFRNISAFGDHSCAMRLNGTLDCWGRPGIQSEPTLLLQFPRNVRFKQFSIGSCPIPDNFPD